MMTAALYSQAEMDGAPLPGPTRAAILLLAMGASGASRVLKHFSSDEIKALKEGVADQSPVSARQVDRLVDEFQDEFKTGSGLSSLDAEMNKLLRSALSVDEISAVFGADDFVDPSLFAAQNTLSVWEAFGQMGVKRLQALLAPEHPQIVAQIVARLESDVSAAVVAGFEPALRNDVMRRILGARPLEGPLLELIEANLEEAFISGSDSAERQARHAALAEIANRMEKAQTDEFLATIEATQPEEAVAIRNLLFAFEDLPNLSKKSRLILFDAVPTEQVVVALSGAAAELAEVVTSSLAARARRMVEAELARGVELGAKEVTAARRAIASAALRMAAEGRIQIVAGRE